MRRIALSVDEQFHCDNVLGHLGYHCLVMCTTVFDMCTTHCGGRGTSETLGDWEVTLYYAN